MSTETRQAQTDFRARHNVNVLRNTYHGTEYRTRKCPQEVYRIASTPAWDRSESERAWVRRVWRRLCGVEGCTCGDELGRRGY